MPSLLCAAAAGDQRASDIYSIAKRIADGEKVEAKDCGRLADFCLWVEQTSADELGTKQYAWCEGCNDVLLPIGKMCKCGTINTAGGV